VTERTIKLSHSDGEVQVQSFAELVSLRTDSIFGGLLSGMVDAGTEAACLLLRQIPLSQKDI